MSQSRFFIACVFLTIAPVANVSAETAHVTNIGNTGFLIESGGKKVLIDAMFDEGWGTYLVLSMQTRDDLKNGRKPFDKIDLILVTHWHDDHFDRDIVATHRYRNKKVVLVAPQQVVERLKSYTSCDKFSSRVLAATPGFGETVKVSVEGIAVLPRDSMERNTIDITH